MTKKDTPTSYRYTQSHEWVKDLGNGIYRLGITDFAQDQIGDVTYVDLPGLDDKFDKDEELATIETVKASEDVFSPLDAVVTKVNEDLEEAPDLLNKDCYEAGWLVELSGEEEAAEQFAALMTPEEYDALVEELSKS